MMVGMEDKPFLIGWEGKVTFQGRTVKLREAIKSINKTNLDLPFVCKICAFQITQETYQKAAMLHIWKIQEYQDLP